MSKDNAYNFNFPSIVIQTFLIILITSCSNLQSMNQDEKNAVKYLEECRNNIRRLMNQSDSLEYATTTCDQLSQKADSYKTKMNVRYSSVVYNRAGYEITMVSDAGREYKDSMNLRGR